MATYTDANGVKLITTGDEAGTWGSTTNVNLQILDRAANGFTSIALTGTTYTLTLSAQPSTAEDGHFKAIKFTGTPGGTCTVTLGEANKARLYMFLNSTDQSVIITQGSGSNVTIPTGKSSIVFADGAGSGAACTDFTSTLNGLSSLESPFTVGGTSVTTTGAELNFVDGVTSAIQTQLDAKQATITGAATTIDDTDLTASRALISNASGKVAVSAVTDTELGYLDGVTSNIQTQLNSKEGAITLTANRAVVSDGSGIVTASDVTSTEVGYLDGVTSAIQTQLNAKQATITGAATTIDDADLTVSRALVSDANGKVAVSAVTSTELSVLDGLTATTTELNYVDGVTSAIQTQLDAKQATITGAATTVDDTDLTASRAVISNASGKIAVSAVTDTELGYLDGVTSAIQTQIDAKQPLGTVTVTVAGGKFVIDGTSQQTVELKPSVTYRFDQSDSSNSSHPLRFSTTSDGSHGGGSEFTTGITTAGTPGSAGAYTQVKLEQDAPAVLYYYCTNHSGMGGKAVIRMSDLTASRALVSDSGGDIAVSAVTDTELGYLDGVTSAIQTQLNAKQATITGAATTIDDTDLTASRALISNASGKVAVSAVTDTELGYLDGVTSAIQTQINAKAPIASPTFTGTVSIPGFTVSGGTQNWTVTASGTNLTFAYNGVNKMRLDSSGNLTVTGDVTAFGTIT